MTTIQPNKHTVKHFNSSNMYWQRTLEMAVQGLYKKAVPAKAWEMTQKTTIVTNDNKHTTVLPECKIKLTIQYTVLYCQSVKPNNVIHNNKTLTHLLTVKGMCGRSSSSSLKSSTVIVAFLLIVLDLSPPELDGAGSWSTSVTPSTSSSLLRSDTESGNRLLEDSLLNVSAQTTPL